MTVSEFEEAVWTLERIRIVIRAPAESQVKVERYPYIKNANQNWRITTLIQKRIKEHVGDIEVVVIRGDGTLPNGNVHLDKLRASYHQG